MNGPVRVGLVGLAAVGLAAAGCGEDDGERADDVCRSVGFSGQTVSKSEPSTAGEVGQALRAAGVPNAAWDQLDPAGFVALCTLVEGDIVIGRAAVDERSFSSVLLPDAALAE